MSILSLVRRALIVVFMAGTLVCCSTTPSSITSQESLAIAESYRTHVWYAQPHHVRHGRDARGIRIDTPDVSYQPANGLAGWWKTNHRNIGVPYQWGGFDSLEEFEAKLKAGAAAGDVYTMEKRRLLDAGVSAEATGIDCSGFISRCWKLPHSHSTRTLPSLCLPITDWAQAKPGDIFNTRNEHVMLFVGWADDTKQHAVVYETGRPPAWKVVRNMVDTSWLHKKGYLLWRYKGMRD